MRGLFVTGTDTDVGKTVVSALLLSYLKQQCNIKYYKPVQSGLEKDYDRVLQLTGLSKESLVPTAFDLPEPMSPNRAADLAGVEISLQGIVSQLRSTPADAYIVEGAGGFEVPINRQQRVSDVAKVLSLPVVVVASTRLGTINHTTLTCEQITRAGLPLAGVILVGDEDPGLDDVLREQGIPVVCQLPRVDDLSTAWPMLLEHLSDWPELFDFISPQTVQDAAEGESCLWHPFTQHKISRDFPCIERGYGAELFLKDGRRVIDAISSWWVNIHGHSHPKVAQAISQQAHTLEHAIFAGFSHDPARQLAARIIKQLNQSGATMSKVFFSDNGSTAVEVAFKMAYQYQSVCGQTKKTRFLALKGGYHGDTLGAMALGADGGFHDVFKPLMMPVDFIDPFDLETLQSVDGSQYAACVIEPMVQGAGGMKMYPPEFLIELQAFCRRHGILLICDEIFTGFFRTGRFFAFEHAGLTPDIVCLSKGLTAGFLPLSLTVTTQTLFDSFLGDSLQEAFLHGHSYTANPIACAAALASLDLLLDESCATSIERLSEQTKNLLRRFENRNFIGNIRSLGTIGAFDVQGREGYFQGSFSATFTENCLRKGALVRPLGGTIYTVPPYCTSSEQLSHVYDVIDETLMELL